MPATRSTSAAASAAASGRSQRRVEKPMSTFEKSKATALLTAINETEEAIRTLEARQEKLSSQMLPEICHAKEKIIQRIEEAEKTLMAAEWENEPKKVTPGAGTCTHPKFASACYLHRLAQDAFQANISSEARSRAELEQVVKKLKEQQKWRRQLQFSSVCLMKIHPVNGINNFEEWFAVQAA